MDDSRMTKNINWKNVFSKQPIFILSLILLFSTAIGGTLAYIAMATNNVMNQFEPGQVACSVNIIDDAISITNEGNVDAYIRADIVVNWMDEDGNVYTPSPTPAQYELGINSTDWTHHSDGFYYYENRLAPKGHDGDTTSALVTSIALKVEPPTGYELSVEVVAEAIQADGDTDDGSIPAYQDAWGISGMFTN